MNADPPLLLDLEGREIAAECLSTQDLCRDLARRGAPEGTVVQALSQTAGRGRESRAWYSPPGLGLYTSLLLRPRLDSADWPALTPLIALALAESLERLAAAGGRLPAVPWQAGIKWPNDLHGVRGKLAGILAETEGPAVVVGLGLNLAQQDFPPALAGRASSLFLEGFDPVPEAEAVLRAFNDRLTRMYASFHNGDRGFLQAGLRRRFMLRGALLKLAVGDAWVEGTATDLGPLGELILQTAAGPRSLMAGEIVAMSAPTA
jgi:BirA family transcriptional regulator, biotin operon repressor / biotin---[acetyl-CoA-carboxylase] ligase